MTKSNETLLSKRITVAMSSIGMNEQYTSFQYLHGIIVDMYNSRECKQSYQNSINKIKEEYSISSRAIHYAINKQLALISNQYEIDNTCHNLYEKIHNLHTYICDQINTDN